jgi:uncharacterized phiE125 gp8 family phage protein
MTDPVLIVAPPALLTLGEAKAHLRVDHDDEDFHIEGLIAGAVAWMDGWQGVLGRCILTQTWAIRTDGLRSMRLPFPDVQSATVSYLDAAGASQTVDPANYRVTTIDGAGRLILANDFAVPTVLAGREDAVTVTAVYGFTVAPPPLKVAALMLVAHWHHNREGAGDDVPAPVKALIAPFRVGLV